MVIIIRTVVLSSNDKNKEAEMLLFFRETVHHVNNWAHYWDIPAAVSYDGY